MFRQSKKRENYLILSKIVTQLGKSKLTIIADIKYFPSACKADVITTTPSKRIFFS